MSSNGEFFLHAKRCSIDKRNGSLCSSIHSGMAILWLVCKSHMQMLLKFAQNGAFELILG